MSEAAAALGRRDADRWLAEAVIEIVPSGRGRRCCNGRARHHPPAEPVPGRPGSAGCTSSASAARACPGSPASCWPAASRCPAATRPSRPLLDELGTLGARVHVGHAPGNLGASAPDTLVVSSAIRADNPELAEARRRGLRVLHRAAALASLMSGRRVIAVDRHARQDDHHVDDHHRAARNRGRPRLRRSAASSPPPASARPTARAGLRGGGGRERRVVPHATRPTSRSSPTSRPTTWTTTATGRRTGRRSARSSAGRTGRAAVTCADDPGATELARRARDLARVRTYGTSPDADYRRHRRDRPRGMETTFLVTAGHGPFGLRSSPETASVVPGQHNALNAAAAFAVAVELGIEPARAAAALARLPRRAARRLEPKGEAGGVRVLDSYAHHPTELAADLRAAREIVERRRPGTGHRRLPAAPVQQDPHLRGRVRRRARAGGRGRGARRLRGA